MAIVSASAASSCLPSSFCQWPEPSEHLLYSDVCHSDHVIVCSSSSHSPTISRLSSARACAFDHVSPPCDAPICDSSLPDPSRPSANQDSDVRQNSDQDLCLPMAESAPPSTCVGATPSADSTCQALTPADLPPQPQVPSDSPSSENHVTSTDRSDQPAHSSTDSQRKQKKIRAKTTKKWRPLSLSDFGFHLSLLPQLQTGETILSEENPVSAEEATQENEVKAVDKNQEETTEIVLSSASDTTDKRVEDSPLAATTSNIDDVAFFKALGIDVTCDDHEDVDELGDWDGVYFTQEANPLLGNLKADKKDMRSSQQRDVKKIQAKPDMTLSSKVTTVPMPVFSPPVPTSKLKKCDRDTLFELECASSRKVYTRKDRHRKVEKAHRAVKSKNCRSIFNNRARKRFYMHHRLVKMHNLNLDFRDSPRKGKVPPIPKKNIDLSVAKSVSRSDRNYSARGPRDRPAPRQNLAYALHESNAPGHLETDLASFLISLQHRELTPEDYDMLLRLDDSVKPKTVSRNILGSLRTETVGPDGVVQGVGEELPMCVICMEPYTAGQVRKFLPCQHNFHSACIDNWLTNSSMNCPLDSLPVGPS